MHVLRDSRDSPVKVGFVLCCFLSTDIQSYNQKHFVKKISTTS